IFVNFDNLLQSTRRKLPFGVAQIGKAFRNEITPGNFIFRTREFEQMEIEFFVNPHDRLEGRPADEVWHDRWITDCQAWFARYGLAAENVKLHEHARDELAHYSKRTVDLLYKFPMGWSELMGIANRTDFDLKQRSEEHTSELQSLRHLVCRLLLEKKKKKKKKNTKKNKKKNKTKKNKKHKKLPLTRKPNTLRTFHV